MADGRLIGRAGLNGGAPRNSQTMPGLSVHPHGTDLRSDDGYAPIGAYGVLGDGRTAALLATDGRIDWWPLPRLDSPPLIAAVLQPGSGGHVALAPAEPFDATRHYLEGTNVVETTYTTASGRVRVTAALNVGAAGRLPWTELAFRVEGVEGRIPMRWEVVPGSRFGDASPWVTTVGTTPVVSLGAQTLAVVTDGMGEVSTGPHGVCGRFTAEAGSRAVLGCTATDGEPVFIPSPAAIDRRLDGTVGAWCRWSR